MQVAVNHAAPKAGRGEWITLGVLLLPVLLVSMDLTVLSFAVPPIAGAFEGTPEMLVAARALQGIGGATLMPSTLALIRTMVHGKQQRRTAVAVWAGS
jgi:MFS family permease